MVAEKEGKGRERSKGKGGLAGGVKGKRGTGKEWGKGCFFWVGSMDRLIQVVFCFKFPWNR